MTAAPLPNDSISTIRRMNGRGDDVMTGGGDVLIGGDIFVFDRIVENGITQSLGNDVITDFQVGIDKLQLETSGKLAGSFAAVEITDTADGALVSTAFGSSVLLQDVEASWLSANDFIL